MVAMADEIVLFFNFCRQIHLLKELPTKYKYVLIVDSHCVFNCDRASAHWNLNADTNEEYGENKTVRDKLALNKIFTYAYSKGNFVNTTELGLDYYELNKYYDYEKSEDALSYIDNTYIKPDKYDENSDSYIAAYMLSSYYDFIEIRTDFCYEENSVFF